MLSIIELHLCLLWPRWRCSGTGIATNHAKLDSMVHCYPEGFMNNMNGMVTQTFLLQEMIETLQIGLVLDPLGLHRRSTVGCAF